ncbi:winged helix DNA-binding protein [Pseudomonas sp.]|uniref:winged helix DNA-binding protein n=1 Tax=Pseudomonas sp. TaxID=306 RepID=UPI0028A79096|nr:winged helix DNA-binding protein [Pseudomonas sp.]
MSGTYQSWGFTDSPFKAIPLGANSRDENLLIGRDQEIQRLSTLLKKTDKWTVVDGEIGSGKTSLINVATYKIYREYLKAPSGTLLIPATRTIQIEEKTTTENFCRETYQIIAESIIAKQSELAKHLVNYKLDSFKKIESLLNSPTITSIGGTLGPIGISNNSIPNESPTFTEAGFNSLIQSWLDELFGESTTNKGGVVIIIDNLELLKTSKTIRDILENLRDKVLNKTGIKWVLCGANGVIAATASTRLTGYLQRTLQVENIPVTKSDEILESRIKAYHRDSAEAYLPFNPENFKTLHSILNKNLRDLLGKVDSYNEEIMDSSDENPKSEIEKDEKFSNWLSEDSKEAHELTQRYSTKKSWSILVSAKSTGSFASSEHERFGYTQQSNFSAAIRELSRLGLIEITSDEDDNRRKNITLTSKAYYALYHHENSPRK